MPSTLKQQRAILSSKFQQNILAFKKNKQNINIVNLPRQLNQNKSLTITQQQLSKSLSTLLSSRSTSCQSYQLIISHLKLIIQSLITKNEFLIKQRGLVLNENYNLKSQIQEYKKLNKQLNQKIIQIKLKASMNGIGMNGLLEGGNIFGILEENDKCYQNYVQSKKISNIVMDQDQDQEQKKYCYYYQQNSQRRQNYSGIKLEEKNNKLQKIRNKFIDNSYTQSYYEQIQQSNHKSHNKNKFSNNKIDNNNNKNNNPMLKSPQPINLNFPLSSCNPFHHSSSQNSIHQTPNYNFPFPSQQQNDCILQEQKIQKIKQINKHYVDISSKFISYMNSNQQSEEKENQEKEFSTEKEKNKRQIRQDDVKEVEISMNNIIINNNNNNNNMNDNNNNNNNNSNTQQLYLPIGLKKNKHNIRFQLDTFKYNLHSGKNSILAYSSKQNSQNQSHQLPKYNPSTSPHHQQYQLHPLLTFCLQTDPQGIFRSFYLSIFRFPIFRQKFILILHQLKLEQIFILFDLYPKNQFWIDMLTNFFKMIECEQIKEKDLIRHINQHKLLDVLIIQTLKSRVQYLFNQQDNQHQNNLYTEEQLEEENNYVLNQSSNHQNIQSNIKQNIQSIHNQNNKCNSHKTTQFFTALANLFDMQCKIANNTYYFIQTQQLSNQYKPSSSSSPQPSPSSIKQSLTLSQKLLKQTIFCIKHDLQQRIFQFEFRMYYQQYTQNNSIVQQKQYNHMRQISRYNNSINMKFKNIQINEKNCQNINNINNNNINENDSIMMMQSDENSLHSFKNEHYFYNGNQQKSSYLYMQQQQESINNQNNNNQDSINNNNNNQNSINNQQYYQDEQSNLLAEQQQDNINHHNTFNHYDSMNSQQYSEQNYYNNVINSQNISIQYNNNSLQNTFNSVKQSKQTNYHNKNQNHQNNKNRQLRQRKTDYNIIQQDYEVILQENQYFNHQNNLSKNSSNNTILYNNNIKSMKNSNIIQPEKQQKQQKSLNNTLNKSKSKNRYLLNKNISYKDQNYYENDNIYSENYILKKVDSVESNGFDQQNKNYHYQSYKYKNKNNYYNKHR